MTRSGGYRPRAFSRGRQPRRSLVRRGVLDGEAYASTWGKYGVTEYGVTVFPAPVPDVPSNGLLECLPPPRSPSRRPAVSRLTATSSPSTGLDPQNGRAQTAGLW